MAEQDDNNHHNEPTDEAALNEEASRELAAMVAEAEAAEAEAGEDSEPDIELSAPKSDTERAAIIETLIFVSDEPLTTKVIASVLREDDKDAIERSIR